jgi:acetyl esterase/lipase
MALILELRFQPPSRTTALAAYTVGGLFQECLGRGRFIPDGGVVSLARATLRAVVLVIVAVASHHNVEAQDLAPKTYTYKTVRDLLIHADVYRTPDATIRPAILYIHGGALIMGNRSWLNPVQVQKYLDAGYAIISIDYRLAPQTKLNEIINDVEDAYRWVLTDGPKLFRIDPKRIAVVGHSAGGYLALMAGVRLKPRPAALVSFYGYGDIAGAWSSRPDVFYNRQPAVTKVEAQQAVGTRVIAEDQAGNRQRFYLYTRQQGLWPQEVVGHDPDREPRLFDPLCPIRNVTKDYPPTLLLHGDSDTDVPFEQSALMAKELERRGVRHEFIALPDRGHRFDMTMSDPMIAAAFDRVLAFLKEQLTR